MPNVNAVMNVFLELLIKTDTLQLGANDTLKNSLKPVSKKDRCTKVKSSAAQNTNLCMITISDCFLLYYIYKPSEPNTDAFKRNTIGFKNCLE